VLVVCHTALKWQDFKSLLAVEKEPNIAKTYQLNFPHSKVVNEDVTNLKL
jgi:site-specific DNA-cytosine methylase